MSGNRVSSAIIGLVAGGKDFEIVTKMCGKYGLDQRDLTQIIGRSASLNEFHRLCMLSSPPPLSRRRTML
jgi:hypothetical protein